MELTKSSKEIIDYECEKIKSIIIYLKDCDRYVEHPIETALAIYSKRYEDISVIDEEDD